MSSKKSEVKAKQQKQQKQQPKPAPKPQPPPRTAEEEAALQHWIHEHWDTTDELGNTPLHRAVLRQDTLYASDLIQKGASVNAVNQHHKTPLHLAVQNPEKNGLVQMLVVEGADVNAKTDKGRSPLFYSHKDHIPYLLKKGCALDTTDTDGLTPFLYAVQRRYLYRASCFLDTRWIPSLEQGKAASIARHNDDQEMMDMLWFRAGDSEAHS